MGSKTVITGAAGIAQPASADDLYAPSGHNVGKHTYIADICNNGAQAAQPGYEDVCTTLTLQSRILAGILFSVSRSSQGEIFPLYLGRNIIGTELDCDVRLMESSVSPSHAVIVIRRTVHDNGTVSFEASVTDCNSQHGTLLNHKRLDYDRETLTDGDILTVGAHYKLLMHLFNTVKYNLKIDLEFDPIIDETPQATDSDDSIYIINDSNDKNDKKKKPDHRTMNAEDLVNFYSPTPKDTGSHTQNETIVN